MSCDDKAKKQAACLQKLTGVAPGGVDAGDRCLWCKQPLLANGTCFRRHPQGRMTTDDLPEGAIARLDCGCWYMRVSGDQLRTNMPVLKLVRAGPECTPFRFASPDARKVAHETPLGHEGWGLDAVDVLVADDEHNEVRMHAWRAMAQPTYDMILGDMLKELREIEQNPPTEEHWGDDVFWPMGVLDRTFSDLKDVTAGPGLQLIATLPEGEVQITRVRAALLPSLEENMVEITLWCDVEGPPPNSRDMPLSLIRSLQARIDPKYQHLVPQQGALGVDFVTARAQAQASIADMEWSGSSKQGVATCPVCHYLQENKVHSPGCGLKANTDFLAEIWQKTREYRADGASPEEWAGLRDRLVGVLSRMEWATRTSGGEQVCPACNSFDHEGHLPGCAYTGTKRHMLEFVSAAQLTAREKQEGDRQGYEL